MTHLSDIYDRTLAELVFECKNGIHIGAGTYLFTKDVLRLYGDYAVIPSTTWKGVFRSISEKLLITWKKADDVVEFIIRENLYPDNEQVSGFNIDEERARRIIDLLEKVEGNVKIRNVFRMLAGKNEELRRAIEKADKLNELLDHEDMDIRRGLLRLVSAYLSIRFPITSLYGGQGVAAKLRFLDTFFKAYFHVRTSVGINRKTKTSEKGRLFSVVIAHPFNGDVKLRLLMDNIKRGSEVEKQLLKNTLRYIKVQGIQIGGEKSEGVGKLTLKIEETVFRTIEVENTRVCLEKLAKPKEWTSRTFDEYITWLEK